MFWFKRKIWLELFNMDNGPENLEKQLPVTIKIIRQIPGPDRPDYWLAECKKPISWQGKPITHLIVANWLTGHKIQHGMGSVPLCVSYVTDISQLKDKRVDFNKGVYVAICMAKETVR